MGVGFSESGGKVWQPGRGIDPICNRVGACLAVDHDERVQRRILAGDRIEAVGKFGVGDSNGGGGIRKIKLQQVVSVLISSGTKPARTAPKNAAG